MPNNSATHRQNSLFGDENDFFVANRNDLPRSHFCPFSRVDRSIDLDAPFGYGGMGRSA